MQEVLDTLQKVNKELNDFAYIVSHDLKAPLRGIGSLATWLENDYADKLDQEGKETLRLIVQRTQRMHNLIDGILDYSKIGRTIEHKEMLNTNSITLQVIDILAIPKNIQVIVDNPLPVVFYDRTKFEQIMVNLLSNAVQFMNKAEGIIHIYSIEKIDRFEISISDNGPGIKEAHFNKIFQIFQTLNPRDIVESTGVGLSIVKKIVESYGGEISVASQIGCGTTFTFSVLKY
jgi:signal transduction histidine kinase